MADHVIPAGTTQRGRKHLLVREYVRSLAAKSASAITLSKRLLYHMDGMTFEAALQAGVHGNAIARETPDAKRGIEQFVKKT